MKNTLFRVLKENDYFNDIEFLNEPDSEFLKIEVNTIYVQEILNIVLSNPKHITVHEPEDFIEKVKNITLDLQKKYL